jgi:hypothetical protein
MNGVSSFFDLHLRCDLMRASAIEVTLTDAREQIALSRDVTLPVRPALAPFRAKKDDPANKRIPDWGLREKRRRVRRHCRQVS